VLANCRMKVRGGGSNDCGHPFIGSLFFLRVSVLGIFAEEVVV